MDWKFHDNRHTMAHPEMEAIYREIDEPLNTRKLFLGGLRSQSNERHLWEAFLPYGHLVEVIFVRDENGKPKGFGFVVFSKAYMMEAVISAHPDMRVIVDGKSVEIKRISEGEPSRSKAALLRAAVPNENTTRVFVGGIPEMTKEQHLREYFSTFGEVVEAEIPPNEKNGKPRGFAFVTFASKDIVGACVGKKFHKFLGKMVEVKRAIEKDQLRRDSAPPIPKPDPPKDKGKAGGGGRGGGGGGRGGGIGGRGGGGGWGGEGGLGGPGWGGDGIRGGHGGGRGGGRGGGFGRGDMRGMHGGPGPGRDFDREFGRDGPPFDQDFGRERPPFDRPMGPGGPRGRMGPDVPGMPRDLMGMGSRGPGGQMDRDRIMERGPDRGPRGPMGPEIPGESMGMGSKGPGGSRDGRTPESGPPGRGPQSFGAMDKWDDAMFDSMPSEEMMRRQFGESPMDFPGEFPGDTPSSRPGASVPEVPGDFRRELSEVERDLEISKNKMKEYYKTMYMWKLKWYQMMKTWTAAKAAAAAEANVGGAGTSRDSFPAASKSQASSYGNTESQWGQAPGQQAPGGGNGAGDPYRGPSEDYSQSQANQGNYSNLGSNYGNMQSGFGPMKKEPSYPGPRPGGPYGGGMPGM